MRRNLFILLLTVGAWVPAFGGQVFSEAIPYLIGFSQEAAIRGMDVSGPMNVLTVSFIDVLPGELIGMCASVEGYLLITINRRYWQTATPDRREALIYHELGHCLLGRHHTKKLKNGRPISLMYPNDLSNKDQIYYLQHKKQYIDELFQVTP